MASEPSILNGQRSLSPVTQQVFQTELAEDRALLNQVERILQSKEFRSSEILRRLLVFLTEKLLSGEADELKEYSIAIDCLGKPSSYDPRHSSAVRIQIGRLRQKLADYYRNEGQEDLVVIDVPKGRFKLNYEIRDNSASAQSVIPAQIEDAELITARRLRALMMPVRSLLLISLGALLVFAGGAVYNWHQPARAKATSVSHSPTWSADMEEIWRPFIATGRPTIVAIEDPLFVKLDGDKGTYYRDTTLNKWQDAASSPAVEALRRALKVKKVEPSRYYTAFGEVDASFLIAERLGSRIQNLSVVKSSDLTVRALADNNVVFIGYENTFFNDEMQAAPLDTPLQPLYKGFRNIHPAPGESVQFQDNYSTDLTAGGIVYALVSHLPGPMGGNDVESFTSSRSDGYVAAVKAFTDPQFVHALVRELKQAGDGQIPRYYQVLLKVKFSADVPTEITYVMARELHYQGKSQQ
jgi:hypothetical protein